MWKAEWGGDIIFSNGLSNSRGVAVLLKRGFDFTINHKVVDDQGRLVILQIAKDQNSFTVANVYAPTQCQLEAQLSFIDSLEDKICKLHPQNVLLGGDFNLCSDPDLDRNPPETRSFQAENTKYGDRVQALCDSLMLFDVWRSLHPDTKRFTFRRGGYTSRLDYWFASNHLLDTDTESTISPCALSDHSLVSIRVGARPPTRGPGIWRLDNALLSKPDYVDTIKEVIREVEDDPPLSSPCADWEWLKFRIKTASIKFAKDSRSRHLAHEKDLKSRFEHLSEELGTGVAVDLGELKSIERELKEIELQRANLAIERSRTNWALYVEKPSKYFLNLQKIRARDRSISQLVTEDGQVLSEHSDILAEEKRFFQDLYSQPALLLLLCRYTTWIWMRISSPK